MKKSIKRLIAVVAILAFVGTWVLIVVESASRRSASEPVAQSVPEQQATVATESESPNLEQLLKMELPATPTNAPSAPVEAATTNHFRVKVRAATSAKVLDGPMPDEIAKKVAAMKK